jgi:hypothetical protein
MKRAIGLVLAVLAFGVVTRADRIEYGGSDYAASAGGDLRSEAQFTDVLQSANLLIGPGRIAFRAGRTFAKSGDAEPLTDYVYYSHFGDSEEALEVPVKSDSSRPQLGSIWGEYCDGLGKYIQVEHSEPFRRALGVQDVPEPGTLLLLGAGVSALALWKRRAITFE